MLASLPYCLQKKIPTKLKADTTKHAKKREVVKKSRGSKQEIRRQLLGKARSQGKHNSRIIVTVSPKINYEMVEPCAPISDGYCLFYSDARGRSIQEFYLSSVRNGGVLRFCHFAQLAIRIFDGVLFIVRFTGLIHNLMFFWKNALIMKKQEVT